MKNIKNFVAIVFAIVGLLLIVAEVNSVFDNLLLFILIKSLGFLCLCLTGYLYRVDKSLDNKA